MGSWGHGRDDEDVTHPRALFTELLNPGPLFEAEPLKSQALKIP